jgi:hypothetical protein
VLKQVTSATLAAEKRFEKIRNAEMGKFAVKKSEEIGSATLFRRS